MRLWIAFSALALVSCSSGSGTVVVHLTDAPGPYEHVDITVSELSMHASGGHEGEGAKDDKGVPGGGGGEGEGGGWVTVDVPAQAIDLLTLQNGVTMELGSAKVPAGSYDMLRMVVSSATVTVNGQTSPLSVPSGAERGVQVKYAFTVGSGDKTDLLLDFDANASVHQEGNGGYTMVPVLSVKNASH
jgi:Domain of unknown function (DUF4382)